MAARHGDVGWLAVFGMILALEMMARDGEQLSDAADRYMRAHPWVTSTVVVVTAAHLTNLSPERIDPWMLAVRGLRRLGSAMTDCSVIPA